MNKCIRRAKCFALENSDEYEIRTDAIITYEDGTKEEVINIYGKECPIMRIVNEQMSNMAEAFFLIQVLQII